MAKSKYLAVLSASAVAALLAGATTAMAADGDIYKTNDHTLWVAGGSDSYIENFEKLTEAVLDSTIYKYEYKGKVYNLEAVSDATANKSGKEMDKALVDMAKVEKGIDVKEFKGESQELKVESISAISDTKISVKFAQPVDEAKSENFLIDGVTVISAELSEDKKEVKLDLQGVKLKETYKLNIKDIKVNGKVQNTVVKEFTMPSAQELFTPELEVKDTVMKADGQSSTLVTLTLKDAKGNVMKNADKVQIAFSTTFGRLAQDRVTVQNGKASVLLTSETLQAAKTAEVRGVVIEAANKNLIGLNANRTVLMDPNPDTGKKETMGASVTEVQASQADRVIVYFNKDVPFEKYVSSKDGQYILDNEKANIIVKTEVGNDREGGKKVPVVGMKKVEGNSKALEFILATEGNKNQDNKPLLTDNANFKVEFEDKTGTQPIKTSRMSKLTDARRPAMLSVSREGLKTLKVVFSEPVNKSSEVLKNWVIDGIGLEDSKYGTPEIKVGTFDVKTGEDTRNVVTITLGKDTKGNQIYFPQGKHSIQGANVGDWADLSDEGNNVMETQSLDFIIPVDNTAPIAKVEVQSPEQYIVTFDKELNENDNTVGNAIKLEKYNKKTDKWEDETKQTIKVTPITANDVKQYKVEVKEDWTKIYDTKATKVNYYNDSYRLVIDKDTVSSAVNGVKNDKIELPLEAAMKTPDVTSPIISKIVKNLDVNKKADGTYTVTMSEPIKGFDGLPTLAQGETKVTPTAQFIKKDGSKTIAAKVESAQDAYDKELKVTPETDLEAGEWTIVVRSISDDIGNTAASATKDFTVKAEEKEIKEDKFAVVWSFADTNDKYEEANKVNNRADYVYVKFNKPVSITGDAKNVLKTSNYQLDGMPLPTGTQIKANIAGCDDVDKITDSITIVLPDGYLHGVNEPHILNISNYLESTTAGDTLVNGGAKKLAWYADANMSELGSDVLEWGLSTEESLYKLEVAANKDLKNEANVKHAEKALDNAKNLIEAKTNKKDVKWADLSIEGIQLTKRYNTAKDIVTEARSNLESLATKVATDYVTTTFDSKTKTFTVTIKNDKENTTLGNIIKDEKVIKALDGYKLSSETIDDIKKKNKLSKDTKLSDLKGKTITVGDYSITIAK